MMQNIFGLKSIKFFHWERFSEFKLKPVTQNPLFHLILLIMIY